MVFDGKGMKERSIAIITARGGSKRIPGKNIKDFCGKPIIVYSIEAAQKSKCFDEIMVSTDSKEIADIAISYGASVPFFRNEKNSDDYATTSDVLLEVLGRYLENNMTFQYGCCIYPTAPFVSESRLREGMEKLMDSEADTVMPMVAYSYPPQRGFVIRNGHFVMEHPEYLKTRSQDIEKIYHDCGQFYCFRVESFIHNANLLSGLIDGIIIPGTEVQDIDTIEDWNLAEMKYSIYKTKQKLM